MGRKVTIDLEGSFSGKAENLVAIQLFASSAGPVTVSPRPKIYFCLLRQRAKVARNNRVGMRERGVAVAFGECGPSGLR